MSLDVVNLTKQANNSINLENTIPTWKRISLLITGLVATLFSLGLGLCFASVKNCYKEFWTGRPTSITPPLPQPVLIEKTTPVQKYQDKDPAIRNFLDQFMKNPAEWAEKLGKADWHGIPEEDPQYLKEWNKCALHFLCAHENGKELEVSPDLHFVVSSWMIEYVLDNHTIDLSTITYGENNILHYIKSRDTLLTLFKRDPNLKNLIDAQNCAGNTPLIRASKYNATAVAVELIDRGAAVNVINEDDCTALHYARTAALASKLLAKEPALLNQCNEDGETPLYLAASRGRTEVVDVLLKHNPDLYILNELKDSVLHNVKNGVIAEKLLEKDKENKLLNLRNCCGETPLHVASRYVKPDVIDVLLKHNPDLYILKNTGASVLHFAPDAATASKILDMDKEHKLLNLCTKNGETPLHYAASNSREDVVEELLKRGADPYILNIEGKSAEQCALFLNVSTKLKQAMSSTFEVYKRKLRYSIGL